MVGASLLGAAGDVDEEQRASAAVHHRLPRRRRRGLLRQGPQGGDGRHGQGPSSSLVSRDGPGAEEVGGVPGQLPEGAAQDHLHDRPEAPPHAALPAAGRDANGVGAGEERAAGDGRGQGGDERLQPGVPPRPPRRHPGHRPPAQVHRPLRRELLLHGHPPGSPPPSLVVSLTVLPSDESAS